MLALHEWCWLSMQDDIALATDAMNKLQGAVLASSERGGIRIEYARTKMGDVVSRILRIIVAKPRAMLAHSKLPPSSRD